MTDQYKKIATLIKQRLSYMKYIAKHKFENNISIEDPLQENKILLHASNKAEILKLSAKSVQAFMMSQIEVSKKIQHRYKKHWFPIRKRISQNRDDDLETIRFNTSKLNDDILLLIANVLKQNTQIKNEIFLYINQIQLYNLKNTDKRIISLSITQISLNNKNSF